MNEKLLTKPYIRLLAAVTLSAALAFALAGVAQAVVYLPDVTKEMSKASYWSQKQQDPDEVLADRATIDQLNEAGIAVEKTATSRDEGTGLQSLKEDGLATYCDSEEQLQIKDAAAQELKDVFLGKVYDEGGRLVNQAYVDEILAQYPTDGAEPALRSPYGIVTTHTTMRCYPTDNTLMYTQGDYDDDNLYLSALRVNEPVLVREVSTDGRFFLCISSCLNAAWVPAADVALCENHDEWLAAWDIPAGKELVVTGYKVRTEKSRVTTNTSNRMLYMGTVLERIDMASAEQLVGTRSAYNNYVCYLPVRDNNGSYSKEPTLIAESAKVNEGFLPLTKENIAKVAFRSLGQMYGWGGMLEANDCSGYVRDVYKCFGLELARNTTWQMNLPVRHYKLEGLDDAHKAAAIAQMPLGTVLFWRDHEMLYLGQENGKLYVISAVGGIGNQFGDTGVNQVKGVVVNTLDMVRGDRSTWLQNLTMANIPYVSENEAGPGLHDLDFYEASVSWPNETYGRTGKPITPDVTIPGLEEGVDYKVSFADNKEVGTATVTLTGKGNYSGELSRTFEIVLLSLEDAKVSVSDQTYTGKALEPAPKVTLSGSTLKAGRDYTVAYKNNTKAGTATVTVTGKGNYLGSKSATFKISKTSLKKAKIKVQDQVYTGKALKPEVLVHIGKTLLEEGVDYEVAYAKNKKVGTAKVTVKGIGLYTGKKSKSFEIVSTSLSKAKVSVKNKTYTGKAVKPKPTVKMGSIKLKKGTDYTVSYTDNVEVGTAIVTVKGKGNFTDSTFATFKIKKASQSIKAKKNVSRTYEASKKSKKLVEQHAINLKKLAKISAKTDLRYKKTNKAGGKRIVVNASTGKVTVKKGLKKGTYKVKVQVKAPGNAGYKSAKAKTVVLKVVVD